MRLVCLNNTWRGDSGGGMQDFVETGQYTHTWCMKSILLHIVGVPRCPINQLIFWYGCDHWQLLLLLQILVLLQIRSKDSLFTWNPRNATSIIGSDMKTKSMRIEKRSMCFISVTPTWHSNTPQPRGANKSFVQLINYSTAERQICP